MKCCMSTEKFCSDWSIYAELTEYFPLQLTVKLWLHFLLAMGFVFITRICAQLALLKIAKLYFFLPMQENKNGNFNPMQGALGSQCRLTRASNHSHESVIISKLPRSHSHGGLHSKPLPFLLLPGNGWRVINCRLFFANQLCKTLPCDVWPGCAHFPSIFFPPKVSKSDVETKRASISPSLKGLVRSSLGIPPEKKRSEIYMLGT